MTEKMTQNSTPSPEQVKLDMVTQQINDILKENKLTIQTTLEGYPYMLRPIVRIVPIPEKVTPEKANEETKENA